jgi:hypothetical protein
MSLEASSKATLGVISSVVISVTLLAGSASGIWLGERRASATLSMQEAADRYHLSRAFSALEKSEQDDSVDLTRLANLGDYCTPAELHNRTHPAGERGPIIITKAFRCRSQTYDGIIWDIIYANSSAGYGGEISVILGLEGSRTLRYLNVLNHQETVGYGERLLSDNNEWINGLLGQSADDFDTAAVSRLADAKKELDAVSGATITARAMTDIVLKAFSFESTHTVAAKKLRQQLTHE